MMVTDETKLYKHSCVVVLFLEIRKKESPQGRQIINLKVK